MKLFSDFAAGGSAMVAPKFNLAEAMFAEQFEAIEDRVLHHADRPMIEMEILGFLDHARGPTGAGVAEAMGIGEDAALVHLQNLRDGGRVWRSSGKNDVAQWHISNAGRRYFQDRR